MRPDPTDHPGTIGDQRLVAMPSLPKIVRQLKETDDYEKTRTQKRGDVTDAA